MNGSGDHDAIVVGGGHNGLICAALLARAGLRTVVLEKRERVGGCTDTSAPWPDHPDFKVNTYSYVAGLMPRRIIAGLDLHRHGLKIHPFGPYFQAYPDGRCLVLHEDPERSRTSIARFSKRDADAYARYEAWLGGIADVLWPLFTHVPPRIGALHPRELAGLLRVAWRARGLGVRGVADLTRLFSMSARDLLDQWFESDELKGILANTATIGAWGGPDWPGTAYVLLHLSMGDPGDGHVGGWGFVRGGMGGLAAACRRAAESHGAEVRTATPVARILVSAGRATGVALASGEELKAPVVVSAIHPKLAFLELVERRHLPADFVADIEGFKCRSGAVKINLALSELPKLIAAPGNDGHEHLTGSMEVAPSPGYVQAAFDDALAGRPAERPIADITIPSLLDDTLMPGDTHSMSLYTQWVPHKWVTEPHREELAAYAERVIDGVDELAPGFRRSIIARQVIGPWEMEQELGLVGGNVYGGELTVEQMFHMRPAPGYADYRTPVRGLYNGSAGAHGGGGVSGIPGWQAFRRVVKDRRKWEKERRPGGDAARPPQAQRG